MPRSLTTRMPNGVSNAAPWQTMGDSGIPDPTYAQVFVDDFNQFAAANYTNTLVGTGTAALTATEPGGVLLANTTAGALDASYFQVPVAGFKVQAGLPLFFKARMKLSDATNCDAFAGLIATGAAPVTAPVDGIFLFKATGATTWVLRTVVGGVTTDYPLPTSLVSANATYQELGIQWDGTDLYAYFNPTTGSHTPISSANLAAGTQTRGYVVHVANFSPTTAILAPSFGIRNGAAVAKSFSMDFVVASAER